MRKRRAWIVSLVWLAAVPLVYAEDVGTAATPAPAAAAEPGGAPSRHAAVEEIIVTAQKREETLQEVPISLSVVNTELIHDLGVSDFHDLALYVPNVSVNNISGTFNDVRIRGFGSPLTNKAFEQPVGLVIDGIPYGRLPYFSGLLFDVERVEVLRGPQGTLFGKNTTAGLFNVITKKPTDEYTGYVGGELGDYEHHRVEVAVGGPIVRSRVNFRLAGLWEERDGYVENTTARFVSEAPEHLGGRERKGLRAQLGLPNVAGAHFVLAYEYSDFRHENVPWEYRNVTSNQLAFFREYDPDTDTKSGNFVGFGDQKEDVRSRIHSFVLNGGYPIGDWNVDLVGGYSRLEDRQFVDNDFTPARMFPVDNHDHDPQYSTEVRLTSPRLPGLFGIGRSLLGESEILGGFFFINRKILDSRTDFGGNFAILAAFIAADQTGVVVPGGCPGCEAAFEQATGFFEQNATSYAGFTHMNWYPWKRWTLEFGMRVTEESKDADWTAAITDGTGAGFVAAFGVEPGFQHSESRSEFAFTPKTTLSYDVTDDISLYAGWGKGFKAGGFNAVIFNDNHPEDFHFKPERSQSYELGAKARLFDGRAALNVGLYRQTVDDFQVFTVTPDIRFKVINAEEARSQGVETDLTWVPTDWLNVRGALGVNYARYVKFTDGTCPFDHGAVPLLPAICDLSDRPIEHTPKWTATVTPFVRYPLNRVFSLESRWVKGLELDGSFTVDYRDVHYANIILDPRTRQEATVRLNTSFGFANPDQGWWAGITIQNVTDESYAAHIREVSIVGKSFVQALDPPRTIVGGVRWQF